MSKIFHSPFELTLSHQGISGKELVQAACTPWKLIKNIFSYQDNTFISDLITSLPQILKKKSLLREFKHLNDNLNIPLLDKIDQDSAGKHTVSRSLFLDGDQLTLADCSLLSKLNIIKVSLSMSGCIEWGVCDLVLYITVTF